jgi:hypothetical protein
VTLETCICAAIRLESGEVFRGHRHDDAIRTAGKCDDVTREHISNAEQGFITSAHRFVGREEGALLQRAAGIPSAHTKALPIGMLFSEDLYLRSTNGMPLQSVITLQPGTPSDVRVDGQLADAPHVSFAVAISQILALARKCILPRAEHAVNAPVEASIEGRLQQEDFRHGGIIT